MADRLQIDRYKPSDGDALAAAIRDIDRKEIYLIAMIDPLPAIRATAANAMAAWTAHYDGKLACIFGVNRQNALSDVGVPWLLGTPEIDNMPVSFLRASRVYYDRYCQVFPQMENWILAENKISAGWLSWLGFDMDQPKAFGIFGAPFIRFTKGFKDVH